MQWNKIKPKKSINTEFIHIKKNIITLKKIFLYVCLIFSVCFIPQYGVFYRFGNRSFEFPNKRIKQILNHYER